MASKERQRWLPLESTAESFNTWSHSASTRPLQDCYGLDAEVLGWVKQPFKVDDNPLFCFPGRDPLVPITEAYEKARLEEDARIEEDGVEHVANIIFFKQTNANACKFGLLYALANAGVPLEPGYLTKLFEQCKDKTPLEPAQFLTATDELERTPDFATQVDLHFCTFVEHKGNLIELDGRRNSPIHRGKITRNLLQDTAVRVKEIIELSNSLEFSLITLNPTPED